VAEGGRIEPGRHARPGDLADAEHNAIRDQAAALVAEWEIGTWGRSVPAECWQWERAALAVLREIAR
jgi:hypothetical protein